jgi:VanZ family protein
MDQPIKRKAPQASSFSHSQYQYICMWLLVVIYIVLIMVMAVRPAPRLPHLKHADKYVHACAYSILAFLSYRPFLKTGWRRPVLMTVTLGLAVGIADEGIQALGNVRSSDRYDLLADFVGAAVGALMSSRFIKPGEGVPRNEAR